MLVDFVFAFNGTAPLGIMYLNNKNGVQSLQASQLPFCYGSLIVYGDYSYIEEYCGLYRKVLCFNNKEPLIILGDLSYVKAFDLLTFDPNAEAMQNWESFLWQQGTYQPFFSEAATEPLENKPSAQPLLRSTEIASKSEAASNAAVLVAVLEPQAMVETFSKQDVETFIKEEIQKQTQKYEEKFLRNYQSNLKLANKHTELLKTISNLKAELELKNQQHRNVSTKAHEYKSTNGFLKFQLEETSNALHEALKREEEATAKLNVKNTDAFSLNDSNIEVECLRQALEKALLANKTQGEELTSLRQTINEQQENQNSLLAELDLINSKLEASNESKYNLQKTIHQLTPLIDSNQWKTLLKAAQTSQACTGNKRAYLEEKSYQKAFDEFTKFLNLNSRDTNENQGIILQVAIQHGLHNLCKKLILASKVTINEKNLWWIIDNAQQLVANKNISMAHKVDIIKLLLEHYSNPKQLLNQSLPHSKHKTLFAAIVLCPQAKNEADVKVDFINHVFSQNLVTANTILAEEFPNILFLGLTLKIPLKLMKCLLENVSKSFSVEELQYLLQAQINDNGNSLLHLAIDQLSKPHIELLLQYGADPYAVNDNDHNALQYCMEIKSNTDNKDYQEIQVILEQSMQKSNGWCQWMKNRVSNTLRM